MQEGPMRYDVAIEMPSSSAGQRFLEDMRDRAESFGGRLVLTEEVALPECESVLEVRRIAQRLPRLYNMADRAPLEQLRQITLAPEMQERLGQPIEIIRDEFSQFLPLRSYNSLKQAGLHTVRDACIVGSGGLAGIRGFGRSGDHKITQYFKQELSDVPQVIRPSVYHAALLAPSLAEVPAYVLRIGGSRGYRVELIGKSIQECLGQIATGQFQPNSLIAASQLIPTEIRDYARRFQMAKQGQLTAFGVT